MKCVYEQEVIIKPKNKIKNYEEYSKEIIKRCYIYHKIKEIKKDGNLIFIKFQYLLPAISQNPRGVFEFYFGDNINIISLKQRMILMDDTHNYFRHMAEQLSKGKKPESYEEFKRKLKEWDLGL